jgi:hypothetical protein
MGVALAQVTGRHLTHVGRRRPPRLLGPHQPQFGRPQFSQGDIGLGCGGLVVQKAWS